MENIILTKKEFDELPEYSCSLPTGTTIGKKWKKNRLAFVPSAHDPRTGNSIDDWYLMEYVEHPDPKLVGIETKRIAGILKLKTP